MATELFVHMKREYFTFSEINDGKWRGSGSSRDLGDLCDILFSGFGKLSTTVKNQIPEQFRSNTDYDLLLDRDYYTLKTYLHSKSDRTTGL